MPAGVVVEDIHATEPTVSPPAVGGLGNLIVRGVSKRPRRTMLYGVQGVGKSTWAASAPNPIFVPTEEGLNDIGPDRFPIAESWEDIRKYVRTLINEEHDYKTVVIDSLDWLEQLIWHHVATERGLKSIEDIGYGKGYTAAADVWKTLLAGLDQLRDRRMDVILVAHARIERYDNPETEGYDRYAPQLHKRAASVVQEWCDEVLFATYKVYTRSEGDGATKKAKGIGGDERILRTTEKPFAVAKNRLGMPDELPMDYAVYASYQQGN